MVQTTISKEVNVINNETANNKNGGMEFIKALKRKEKDEGFEETKVSNKIVGGFGIVGQDGLAHKLFWSVNGSRKDQRHGVIDKPVPQSRYAKSLLDSMFKGWY